jgi:hypothetical protein
MGFIENVGGFARAIYGSALRRFLAFSITPLLQPKVNTPIAKNFTL